MGKREGRREGGKERGRGITSVLKNYDMKCHCQTENGNTQDIACHPRTTAHCSVRVGSCLVAAKLVASRHCGCGTSELRVWDGRKHLC